MRPVLRIVEQLRVQREPLRNIPGYEIRSQPAHDTQCAMNSWRHLEDVGCPPPTLTNTQAWKQVPLSMIFNHE